MDSLEKFVVPHRSPKYPGFVSPNARARSFLEWKGDIDSRFLVDAGFFHLGPRHVTACFHCGRFMNNWKEGDDPFVVHARWNSDCEFLIVVKGKSFVREVRRLHSELLDTTFEGIVELSKKEGVNPSTYIRRIPDSYFEKKAHEDGREIARLIMHVKEKPTNIDPMCGICYVNPKCTVFLPCGHLLACPSCAVSLDACPYCRKKVEGTFKTFIV
jgi:baculoviral IAP repeat-containing protein 7/8